MIRFKREDGTEYPEWENVKIGKLYQKVIEKNDLSFGKEKIISVANMYFKDPDNRDSQDDEYMKTYNVMRLGDIAFEGHENKEHKYGRFVANTIGDGIVSHIFIVLRPVNSDHNQIYWKYVINNELLLGPILRISTKKSTMMHDLVIDDFLKCNISVPCKEEQQKIADFLSSVDEVIAASEQEVANLETQKKAVMKKIFSQEVRFKRKDGSSYPEWKCRKFGELYKKTIEKNDLSFGKDKIISVANMYFKKTDERDALDDDYMKSYNVMRVGDIAFEGNKSKRYAHGRFVENTIGDGIVSHVFDVFRPLYPMNLSYWKEYINYEPIMGKILVKCTKSSTMMTNLVSEDFLLQQILVPCEEEQRLIADFLSDLDEAIAAAKKELELWKELKKGLLQQMFV